MRAELTLALCGLLLCGIMTGTKAETDAVTAAKKEGQPPANGTWGLRKAEIKDATLPHVLLIGDSINGGYNKLVIKQLEGKANVDVWETPLWLGGGLFKAATDIFKENRYDAIHFNESGLHAWAPGRIPDGQYGPLMESYIKLIKENEPGAKLIWATTTPIRLKESPRELDPVLNKLVADRNEICRPIIEANGVAVDDLYAVIVGRLDLASNDQFHWSREGYQLMAKSVTDSVETALKKE